jgi:hypothetical protein
MEHGSVSVNGAGVSPAASIFNKGLTTAQPLRSPDMEKLPVTEDDRRLPLQESTHFESTILLVTYSQTCIVP